MIKTFEFEVSNAARYYLNGDTSTAWFKTDLSRLTNTEGIDEIIGIVGIDGIMEYELLIKLLE